MIGDSNAVVAGKHHFGTMLAVSHFLRDEVQACRMGMCVIHVVPIDSESDDKPSVEFGVMGPHENVVGNVRQSADPGFTEKISMPLIGVDHIPHLSGKLATLLNFGSRRKFAPSIHVSY
ncbi:hypothetical protein [Marinobacter sp. SS8-8]|uniref:hypothetical protein n=1 Tax=Marinobacter sp. SS8-8 TaxID=3050452 RepID=UPI0026E05DAC|nr:hypothetical protein [Marinobacter sp. SS8-8]